MSETKFTFEEVERLIRRAEAAVRMDNLESAIKYPIIGPSIQVANNSVELVGLKIRQFMYESMSDKRDIERKREANVRDWTRY